MNQPASAISIRIQLPDDEKQSSANRAEEVVILWDRVIFVGVCAVLLLAALGYGGWRWLASDDDTLAREVIVAAPQAAIPEMLTPKPTPNPAPDKPVEAVPAKDPVASLATAPSATPPARASSEQKIEPKAVVKQVDEQNVAIVSQNVNLSASPVVSLPNESLAQVTILSEEHVVRAQITPLVEFKEPVGVSPAVISMDTSGLIKVYFFTELRDLKGQKIFYDWYRNGERQARVFVRPYNNVMRASSSKFIDQHMVGQWQVKVHSEGGTPLAEGTFEVR